MDDFDKRPCVAKPFDWLILDRYLADDISPDDLALLQDWVAKDSSRSRIVEGLLAERDRRVGVRPEWDLDALRDRIADRTSPKPIHATAEKKVRALRLFPMARSGNTRRPWVRFGGYAAAAAIVGTAGLFVSHDWSQNSHPSVPAVKMRDYVTTRGQIASIYLADGTRVVLAPESRLHVPESIADHAPSSPALGAREVKLEGAAFFNVVHDKRRPFSVETPAGIALDIGTEFEVRAYEPTHPMQVTVVSGAVGLHTVSRGAPLIATLRRGDRGTLSRAGDFTVARNVDLGPTVAWAKGILVFDSRPVSDVVGELSRWYDLDVRLGQGIDQTRRLVLTLDNESAADALKLVALSLGLRVEERGRVVTLQPQ
jgi:transmembrane sensor